MISYFLLALFFSVYPSCLPLPSSIQKSYRPTGNLQQELHQHQHTPLLTLLASHFRSPTMGGFLRSDSKVGYSSPPTRLFSNRNGNTGNYSSGKLIRLLPFSRASSSLMCYEGRNASVYVFSIHTANVST